MVRDNSSAGQGNADRSNRDSSENRQAPSINNAQNGGGNQRRENNSPKPPEGKAKAITGNSGDNTSGGGNAGDSSSNSRGSNRNRRSRNRRSRNRNRNNSQKQEQIANSDQNRNNSNRRSNASDNSPDDSSGNRRGRSRRGGNRRGGRRRRGPYLAFPKPHRGQRIKVLVAGAAKPPGGMATIINQAVESSISNKTDITLFDNSKRTPKNRSLTQAIKSQLAMLKEFRALLKSKKPDVVHVHTGGDFDFYRNSLYIFLARLNGAKVVYQNHLGRFNEFYNNQGFLKRRFVKFTFNRCQRVIALSQWWKDSYKKITNEDRIVILHNAIKSEPFYRNMHRNKARQILGIPKDKKMVLVMSVKGKGKGSFDVVDAATLIKRMDSDILLTMVGPDEWSSEGANAELERIANEHDVADVVDLRGEADEKMRYIYYAAADAFLLPSYSEGAPMSVIEAMAAKLPVVATTVGAIPEMVEHEKTGLLVEPGRPGEIAEAVIQLFRDENTAREMGREGQKRFRQLFDMERVFVRNLWGIYRDLAGDVTADQDDDADSDSGDSSDSEQDDRRSSNRNSRNRRSSGGRNNRGRTAHSSANGENRRNAEQSGEDNKGKNSAESVENAGNAGDSASPESTSSTRDGDADINRSSSSRRSRSNRSNRGRRNRRSSNRSDDARSDDAPDRGNARDNNGSPGNDNSRSSDSRTDGSNAANSRSETDRPENSTNGSSQPDKSEKNSDDGLAARPAGDNADGNPPRNRRNTREKNSRQSDRKEDSVIDWAQKLEEAADQIDNRDLNPYRE